MKLITRQQYLDGESTHREFYAQFVTEGVRRAVAKHFGIERLKQASSDPHLNSIPLAEWDGVAHWAVPSVFTKMKACGDALTLAGSVCILKEAAKQCIEKGLAKQKDM
jgi:hypothetical protein